MFSTIRGASLPCPRCLQRRAPRVHDTWAVHGQCRERHSEEAGVHSLHAPETQRKPHDQIGEERMRGDRRPLRVGTTKYGRVDYPMLVSWKKFWAPGEHRVWDGQKSNCSPKNQRKIGDGSPSPSSPPRAGLLGLQARKETFQMAPQPRQLNPPLTSSEWSTAGPLARRQAPQVTKQRHEETSPQPAGAAGSRCSGQPSTELAVALTHHWAVTPEASFLLNAQTLKVQVHRGCLGRLLDPRPSLLPSPPLQPLNPPPGALNCPARRQRHRGPFGRVR